ncbi:hypothetical protein QEN19_003734 [Hanseniaspora menglaensis]
MFSQASKVFPPQKPVSGLSKENAKASSFSSSQLEIQSFPKILVNATTFMLNEENDFALNTSAIEFSDEDNQDESEYIQGYKYEHKNLMTMHPSPIPIKTDNLRPSDALSKLAVFNHGSTTRSVETISGRCLSAVVTYSSVRRSSRDVSVFSVSPENNKVTISSFSRRKSSVSKMPNTKPLKAFKVLNLDTEDECNESENDISDINFDGDELFKLDGSITEGSLLDSYNNEKKKRKRMVTDFLPLKFLGEGAYGKVLLVKEKSNGKVFAMKQMCKSEILVMSDEIVEKENTLRSPKMKQVERTFSERNILKQIEHPNIVKLFYSFHDMDQLYLILQFIPGGELFYHLNKLSKFSETVASFYTLEISLAIKFLHEKGIVYRDLKPENCLLNEKGHLILTDFGLSKTSSDDRLYSYCGTPEYAAPELLSSEHEGYSKSVDWYSVGCVLFDMLTSKPPYEGTNPVLILQKINKDPKKLWPNFPHYLSSDMKDFLSGLLNRDPLKRWNVDLLWDERYAPKADKDKRKQKKKKKSDTKTSYYKQHNIFRTLNWDKLSKREYQEATFGPIVPIITDANLAENFDEDFTSRDLTAIIDNNKLISQELTLGGQDTDLLFEGFSYEAENSFLDRYIN